MSYFLFLSSFLLGFLTKYCDKKYNLKILIISLFSVALMIFLSTFDDGFVVLFPIFLGVLIGGKLDELHFKIDGLIYGIYSLIRIIKNGFPLITIPIMLAAAIDELGNDLADKKKLKLLKGFFEKRLFLDVFCFALALLSYLSWRSVIILLCYDVGYQLATKMKV